MYVGSDKSIETNPKRKFKEFYPREGKVVFEEEKEEDTEKEEKKVVKKDLSKK